MPRIDGLKATCTVDSTGLQVFVAMLPHHWPSVCTGPVQQHSSWRPSWNWRMPPQ